MYTFNYRMFLSHSDFHIIDKIENYYELQISNVSLIL